MMILSISNPRDAMYNPSHFVESRVEVLQTLVRAYPLATLITLSNGGLVANHIPMVVRQNGSPFGMLVGHVARANTVWSATDFTVPALVCFQGPQAYISPSLYATKQEHGKVVPTWNYVVVQASGPLTIHDDPVWVRAQVTELTQQQEASRATPWSVDDAPRDYTDAMLRVLVGISVPITTLTGKWKVSQNQPAANQASVVQALAQSPHDQAHAMAQLVQQAAQAALAVKRP